MKKLLFITMGSSLFESATWEHDREPAASLALYRTWVDDPRYLDSPSLRGSCPEIVGEIEEAIQEDNASDWADCLPADLPEGRRCGIRRKWPP
jgi:hypothetical protein